MNQKFEEWLVKSYGMDRKAAQSRVSNIRTIEKYYGDIDVLIASEGTGQLIQDLSYTTDDERNKRPAAHKVQINGNLRIGSATLKQAFMRYLEFRKHQNASLPGLNILVQKSRLIGIKADLENTLNGFKPRKKASYSKKEVVEHIQKPLLDLLKGEFPDISWSMEYQPNNDNRDRFDINGKVDEENAIIIEIDTHRVDQITKKYVSRQTLTDDLNTIYVILVYPNSHKNADAEKKELGKYIQYLETLTNALTQSTNLEKYLIVHKL